MKLSLSWISQAVMMFACFVVVATILSLSVASPAAPPAPAISQRPLTTSIAALGLQKVLHDAAPIFGDYVNVQSPTALWMKNYPDSTPLVHMNIPGTHDPQTCTYSLSIASVEQWQPIRVVGTSSITGNSSTF
jgi:1-phosphatidylinositol phosphodiesterase